MQFTCQQDQLHRGLTLINHAVARGQIGLPILKNLCLRTEGSHLKLVATNLEIGINTFVEAQIAQPGDVAVPARLFLDLIASLPSTALSITVAQNLEVQVKAAGQDGSARVRGVSTEEFPPVPGAEQCTGPSVELNAALLRQTIGEVTIAADHGGTGSRPVLESVLLQVEQDQMTLAAADGFRLSFKTIPLLAACDLRRDILVPVATLLDLGSILPSDGTIQMSLNQGQVIFHTPTMSLTSRLVEGKYPNYRAMLPASCPTRAVVQRSTFADIVKVIALFARNNTKVACVTLRAGSGTLSVASEDADFGGSEQGIAAQISGEDLSVAFNVIFLAEALAVCSSTEVILEIGRGRATSGLLRAIGPHSCTHFFLAMNPRVTTQAEPVAAAAR